MIKIFITGPPGSGKTTAVLKVYETLRMYNYNTGGFITVEERVEGRRVGFKIRILDTGEQDWLAHIDFKEGPRVGKYVVNVKALDTLVVAALNRSLLSADVIIMDEIGPMEMCSQAFSEAVKAILASDKVVISTIHYRMVDELRTRLKTNKESVVYMLTRENREAIPLLVWRNISPYLKKLRANVQQ